MKKHIIYILFLIPAGIMSCEQEVNIELPKSPPKLVLTSFISPQDTSLTAVLTKSIPIFESRDFDDYNRNVKDALVTISGNGQEATLYYDDHLGKYIGDINDLLIEEGKTYVIKATTPDGLNAEGYCTVPSRNTSLSFTYTELGPHEWGGLNYRVDMTWEASQNDSYAYRVYGEFETAQEFYHGIQISYSEIYISNPYSIKGNNKYTKSGEFNYRDEYSYVEKKIRAILMNVEENYYRYHKSVATYSGDNPFAEPAAIYTNIKGGLGVFGAYNKYVVVQEF